MQTGLANNKIKIKKFKKRIHFQFIAVMIVTTSLGTRFSFKDLQEH